MSSKKNKENYFSKTYSCKCKNKRHKHCKKTHHCHCKKNVSCKKDDQGTCQKVPIFNRDINNLIGYTINQPGAYCLAENIEWNAIVNGTAAITINANNVSLDLSKRTIQQISNTTSNNIGILIGPNLNNIKIYGGSIVGFSGLGIFVREGNNTILLSELVINKCGFNGAFSEPLFTRPFSGGILVAGLDDNFVNNVTIEKSNLSEIIAEYPNGNGGANGITIFRANNVVISNVDISNIRSNGAATPLFIGLLQNASVVNCTLRDVRGTNNANGIDSMTNMGTLNRSSHRFVVKDTIISDIIADNNEALGVEPNADDFEYTNVYVNNVQTTGPTSNRAVGFVTQSFNPRGIIENCIASNIICAGNFGGGASNNSHASGFFSAGGTDEPFAGQVVYRNCKAMTIISNNPLTRAAGFRNQNARNTIYDNCTVQNVNAPLADTILSFGIWLSNARTTTVSNSIVQNTNGHGIRLDNNTTLCIINNNLTSNTNTDPGYYGISDADTNSNNRIFSNKGYKSPIIAAQLPNGTPVRDWPSGLLPSTTDNNGIVDPLDNINIQ